LDLGEALSAEAEPGPAGGGGKARLCVARRQVPRRLNPSEIGPPIADNPVCHPDQTDGIDDIDETDQIDRTDGIDGIDDIDGRTNATPP